MKLKPIKKRAYILMEEIIEIVAQQNGMTKLQVREILFYTYGHIAKTIRAGNLEGVRLKHFGSFAVKPFKKLKYEKDRTENKRGRIPGDTNPNKRKSRSLQKETDKEGSNNQDKALS